MECTAFVTVFLFSLLAQPHGVLVSQPRQAGGEVCPSSRRVSLGGHVRLASNRQRRSHLTYVCDCAKLSYKEVRSAVISARAWFAGQSGLTKQCEWHP